MNPAFFLRITFLAFLSTGFIFQSQAFSQKKKTPAVTAKFGKGIRFMDPDSSMYLKFEARFQTLFQGNYDLTDNSSPFSGEMMIRRARLKFSGFVYKPGFEYKIELGLSNRDIQVRGRSSDYANIVLDAYMRVKLYNNLKLRVGQFKLPGNRERIVSSGSLQIVDRSLVNSRFNIDRDAGVMLENKTVINKLVLKEYASIATGEGRNRLSKDDAFCYSGRLEILPMGEFANKGDLVLSAIHREESPKISVGLSASYNNQAERARGQLGDYLYANRDMTVLEADFIFKYQGWSALGEVAMRTSKRAITEDAETGDVEHVYTGKGWNIQAGYMFKNNVEIAARVTEIYPDMEIWDYEDNLSEYTVALSKFWVGHNLKVQGDLTYALQNPNGVSANVGRQLIARITTNLNF